MRVLFFALIFVAAPAQALTCHVAGIKTRALWKSYVVELAEQESDLATRLGNRANAKANPQWYDAHADLDRRRTLAEDASREDRYGLLRSLQTAYLVPLDSRPAFAAARAATDDAWQACHPGSSIPRPPAGQHAVVAVVWRTLYEAFAPADRARLESTNTGITDRADWNRLSLTAVDFAIQVILPFDLESAGAASFAARYRSLPRIVNANSARAIVPLLEQTSRDLYTAWGKTHEAQYRSLEATFFDVLEAAKSARNVDQDTISTNLVLATLDAYAKAAAHANPTRARDLGLALLRALADSVRS